MNRLKTSIRSEIIAHSSYIDSSNSWIIRDHNMKALIENLSLLLDTSADTINKLFSEIENLECAIEKIKLAKERSEKWN